MFIRKEDFEVWMERIMDRFDRQDGMLIELSKKHNTLDGERLLDNQDVCQLLNVSKRTLQRYRSLGELPYQTIHKKTYYKESDIRTFFKNAAKKIQIRYKKIREDE